MFFLYIVTLFRVYRIPEWFELEGTIKAHLV